MLLSKLMTPSGPCSRDMPKAEAWTGDRRMEPAPIPTMLWRPVNPGISPTNTKVTKTQTFWLSAKEPL